MRIRGEFVVRQVMDNIVAIPTGQTALHLNGLIMLNEVSHLLWTRLEQDTDIDALVNAVTEAFEVSADQAQTDVLEFIEQLRRAQLLEE